MLKNLLPQGTRTVEICSAYALVIVGILTLPGYIPVGSYFNELDHRYTWGVVLSLFGMLQVVSLIGYPKLELLRVLMSWVNGCLWIWIGAFAHHGIFKAEDIGTILLGMGNLYGFVLNFNQVRLPWTT